MGKYDALGAFLRNSRRDRLRVSLAEVSLSVSGLPSSAREHACWWGNDRVLVQARGWLDAGFEVAGVDLTTGTVEFCRAGDGSAPARNRSAATG
jgi:hypothetical protein